MGHYKKAELKRIFETEPEIVKSGREMRKNWDKPSPKHIIARSKTLPPGWEYHHLKQKI